MTKIIEFKNINKSFDHNRIFQNFNLEIEQGEFLTVLGTSGSGKTTLLKMINGLIEPDSGDILYVGKNIKDEDLISLRRKIGYAIQGNILFPHLTVAQNIAYVPNLLKYPPEEIEKIIDNQLKMVNLPNDLKHRFPNELSGGQQQRVGIARAYAANPDVLLMDEPFGAVDSITRYQLQADLKRIHQQNKSTIIFITHDISEALKLGTKVLILDKGLLQQYASPKEIITNPANSFVEKLIAMKEEIIQ